MSIRHITDYYIEGTTLRLREQREDSGLTIFKLTQKIPGRAGGAQQGLITNMYLAKAEFSVLAQLSAKRLSKTRHSMPPFGIDVFEAELKGLFLAEIEFDSDRAAEALDVPSFALAEVTTDDRFTGGELVRASRQDIQVWLSDYGIKLGQK